jgi:hypothetical protein
MIGRFLSFIRFSHTIFALPFALGSMFVPAHGLPACEPFRWSSWRWSWPGLQQ